MYCHYKMKEHRELEYFQRCEVCASVLEQQTCMLWSRINDIHIMCIHVYIYNLRNYNLQQADKTSLPNHTANPSYYAVVHIANLEHCYFFQLCSTSMHTCRQISMYILAYLCLFRLSGFGVFLAICMYVIYIHYILACTCTCTCI